MKSKEALICPVDIYARVSTAEQAEVGYSISEQESKLLSYCQAFGYQVHRVAKDPGFSGGNLDRPGIQDVIKDARGGKIKKVIVWKLDRLSRSQKDTMALLEDVFLPNGVDFVSLEESFDTSTPIGRCMVGILSAFAQMERENIVVRTQMGKEAAVRAGRCVGRAPIGWRKIRGPDGKTRIEADPFESVIVQECYQLYNQGLPLLQVWKALIEKYGCRDVLAHEDYVTEIIRNPINKGYVRYRGKVSPGLHDGIVSEEAWEAANARLRTNKPHPHSTGLVSGIIYCGCCGARMSIKTVDKRHKGAGRFYACYSVTRSSTRMARDPNCRNREYYYRVEELDNIIMERVGAMPTDPDAIRRILKELQAGQDTTAEREAMEKELRTVDKQIARLLDIYQAGALELDEVTARLAPLKDKKTALLKSLEEEKARAVPLFDADRIVEELKDFSSLMETGTHEARKIAIQSLIRRVEVFNEGIKIFWSWEPE